MMQDKKSAERGHGLEGKTDGSFTQRAVKATTATFIFYQTRATSINFWGIKASVYLLVIGFSVQEQVLKNNKKTSDYVFRFKTEN